MLLIQLILNINFSYATTLVFKNISINIKNISYNLQLLAFTQTNVRFQLYFTYLHI